MPPIIQLNGKLKLYRAKQKSLFGDKVQKCKSKSGLQFIKFDFMTGGQEIKLSFVSKLDFFSRYFVALVNISLLSTLSATFLSYYNTIKQAQCKLMAVVITIKSVNFVMRISTYMYSHVIRLPSPSAEPR